LSADQREKWNAMLGKRIDLAPPRRGG
jgi:hypothetical protein